MKKIMIADMTIRESVVKSDISMSFKEKLEVAKQLEKLKVDVIEMPEITDDKADALLLKSLVPVIKNSILSVNVGRDKANVQTSWSILEGAAHPRLCIAIPTSPVQMEYVCGKKPQKVAELIEEQIKEAKKYCKDVEFSAIDATRSEEEFLQDTVKRAIAAGATIINFCDSAGVMLPDEFRQFMIGMYDKIPELSTVTVSAECSDELKMAVANAFSAAAVGATQIKTTISGQDAPMLQTVAHAMTMRGETCGMQCSVRTTELQRAIKQMSWLSPAKKDGRTLFEGISAAEENKDMRLNENAVITEVIAAVKSLGYELSDDDNAKVYEEFSRVAKKKDVGVKELEAIIATAALQVPPTYRLVDFVINSGNIITPTANITLEKNKTLLRGLSSGDGPIEAAFEAIGTVIGHHYELDDFQIQSVTEGSEAVGAALVKIRSNGRLFSGNGVSTDIIGASIRAYLNAVNKVVYEEKSDK